MEPTQMNLARPKTSAKDFILNLGAFVALYTVIVYVLDLLFTVINTAYPQITDGYNYYASQSISWPVAVLIIFFPVFILLQWVLAKQYMSEPEKKNVGIHKWLTYITLFFSGLTLAIDLVTVLSTFLNGEEITTGFILKAFAVLAIAGIVFFYYISDVRRTLTTHEKKSWVILSALIVIGSIGWGFYVLGSPRTQQLYRYDEEKVSDLQTINNEVTNYFQDKGYLPGSLSEISAAETYVTFPVDEQTGASYEYILVGQSAKAYQLCATFNKSSQVVGNGTYPVSYPYGDTSWTHPAGHYCFSESIPVSMYPAVPKLPM